MADEARGIKRARDDGEEGVQPENKKLGPADAQAAGLDIANSAGAGVDDQATAAAALLDAGLNAPTSATAGTPDAPSLQQQLDAAQLLSLYQAQQAAAAPAAPDASALAAAAPDLATFLQAATGHSQMTPEATAALTQFLGASGHLSLLPSTLERNGADADVQALEAAQQAGQTLHIPVNIYSMPEAMKDLAVINVLPKREQYPVLTLEVPATADLAYLKRAVNRALNGQIPPSTQRMFVAASGKPMEDERGLLTSWELENMSIVYLAIVEEPAAGAGQAAAADASGVAAGAGDDAGGADAAAASYQALSQAALQAGGMNSLLGLLTNPALLAGGGQSGATGPAVQQLITATLAMQAMQAHMASGAGIPASAYAVLNSAAMGAPPAAAPSGGGGSGGASKKQPKEGNKSSKPRERFTEEEIVALVEGVRLYGTSWTKIKAAFPGPLARRTQLNLKDKWRNLQRGMASNWRDERSHISDEVKQKIRELSYQLDPALAQQPAGLAASLAVGLEQDGGLPAGLEHLAGGGQ